MSAAGRPLIEARRDQIFPTLAPEEIDRLRRFGEPRSYREGELLVRTGEPAPGLLVILAGEVAIAQRDDFAPHPPIFVHRPGSFLGELAQLSGSPSLVDGIARSAVEALVIPRRSCAACWSRRPSSASASCAR